MTVIGEARLACINIILSKCPQWTSNETRTWSCGRKGGLWGWPLWWRSSQGAPGRRHTLQCIRQKARVNHPATVYNMTLFPPNKATATTSKMHSSTSNGMFFFFFFPAKVDGICLRVAAVYNCHLSPWLPSICPIFCSGGAFLCPAQVPTIQL